MRFFLLVAAVGLALVAGHREARAQPCFPECRAGYTCEAGQCVRQESDRVEECLPACRSGYRCEESRCVAEVTTGARLEAPRERKPRGPPALEIALHAFWLPIFGVDETEFDQLEPGEESFGGRSLTFSGQVLFRRGDSNTWFAADLGYGLVRHGTRDEFGGSSGDSGGFILGGGLVQRIPIQGPGYDLLVDHRVSFDPFLGAYVMTAEGLDAGARAGANLSIYWFQVGALITYGIKAPLGVNVGTSARVSF